MNCFRCGFDYTGSECLVCGKLAPTPENPAGADSDCLRIAVIVPDTDLLPPEAVTRLKEGSDHYQTENATRPARHIFVYTPDRACSLFDLLRITEKVKDRTILFNGRRRPYDTDLWLPLLWYMT